MLAKKIALLFFIIVGCVQAENNLGMNLNNRDIEVHATWDIKSMTDIANQTHYYLYASLLHEDNSNNAYKKLSNGINIVQAGFFAQNSFQSDASTLLSFGMKVVSTKDYIAMVPSGRAEFFLDLSPESLPTSLVGEFSYAPSLLNFMDALNYLDFKLEADVEIIPNIVLYAGYRYIDAQYISSSDHTDFFNNNLYAGMKITF